MKNIKRFSIALFGLLAAGACNIPLSQNEDGGGSNSTSATYVFVASGNAYAGLAVAMSTPSQTVARYRSDGAFDGVVFDYNTLPGDSPVGLANYDADHILVLVYNASGSRVDIVRKDGTSENPGIFIPSGAGLAATVRSIRSTADGGWIVSRTAAVEKFNSSKQRLLIAGNAYVNNPAGVCATTNTAVVGAIEGPNNNIIYTHAAASANNKTVMIKPNGYTIAGDCLSSVTGTASANHLPTGAVLYYNYGGASRLLVAYGNNTGFVHEIYTYPVSSTTISAGTSAYMNTTNLQGASAMAMLPDGTVLVAMAASTLNSVQRFTYDTTLNTLSLASGSTFIPTDLYTKSISALLVATGSF